MKIQVLGIDIAQHIFHVHGVTGRRPEGAPEAAKTDMRYDGVRNPAPTGAPRWGGAALPTLELDTPRSMAAGRPRQR